MLDTTKKRRKQRTTIHKRIRAKVAGNAERPRVSVFRSNAHMFVQVIDDVKQNTLVSVSDAEAKEIKGKTNISDALGKILADKMKAKKITNVVFDRGGYQYHGRVKALADSLRKEGINF